MNHSLRRFVLWLLIVALPLQGFAAVTRLCCDAAQMTSSTSVSALFVDASAMPSHHGHDAGPGDMHHAESDAKHPKDKADSHDHKANSCNACAACFVGGIALPTHVVWSAPLTKDVGKFATPSALVTGFIPDSLERPPKHLSA